MRVVKIMAATLALGLGAVSAISASATTPAAILATKKITVPLSNEYNDVVQVAASGTSWLIVGNLDKDTVTGSTLFPSEASIGGTDGYLTMLDSSLNPVWTHRFGTANDDVATALTRDSAGVIWTVGVSTKQVEPTPVSSPTQSPAVIPTFNPDGVATVSPTVAPAVADQLLVSSWNSAGQLLTQSVQTIASGVALNPTSAVVGNSGIYVVGTAVNATTGISQGFYVLVAKDGSIGSVHWLGVKAVVLRSAAVLSNGTLMVAGSIAETLKGRLAIGPVDGFIAVVNPISGAIIRTQRSGNKSVARSWESISVDRQGYALAVGPAIGSKSEVVASSFTSTGAVKFTLRLANPVGTQLAVSPPTGAFAALAVAANRPGKSSIEAFLTPIATNGRLLRPTYLVGLASSGLMAGAVGTGYLLVSGNPGMLTVAWFTPRSEK